MPIKKINIYDIINCNLDYECHLEWDSLDQTDMPDIRLCKDCKSTVTFVRTQEELAVASTDGKCVAYITFKGEALEKVLYYNQHGGDFPLSAPPVTMGIPNRES
jgi:hypothetical protein